MRSSSSSRWADPDALASVVTRLVAIVTLSLGSVAPLAAQGAPPDALAEIRGQFEASARKLVALAQAMPASSYDWSPGDGVASVARVYMHIARYNYMYPDENLGLVTPVTAAEYGRWEASVRDKEEAVAILERSMTYVRSVFDEMPEDAASREVELYGRRVGQWAVLLQLVTHMNEHLGQSIAYARMNGVVPPWSG